jgi:hypothetical protein
MRLLQGPPLTPVFLLEDREIGQRQPLPPVSTLPFGMFIDDQLRVHFELNHQLNILPPPGWRDFFSPMRRYLSMAPKLIARSLLKGERRLIGGLYGIYKPAERHVVVVFTGVLRREEIPDVPADVRNRALDVMGERLHQFNQWLGADFVHSGPTAIPDKVMRRVGWERYRIRKWKNRWRFFRDSFPMCLRLSIRFYVKKYRDVDIEP